MNITLQMMDAAKRYLEATGLTELDFSRPESIKLDLEIMAANQGATWQYRKEIAHTVIQKVLELS